MKRQLLAVIDALEDLQATGHYIVMYSVSGHVCDFSVEIFCGEWYNGAKPMFKQSIYTDRPLSEQYGNAGKLDLLELESFVRALVRKVSQRTPILSENM